MTADTAHALTCLQCWCRTIGLTDQLAMTISAMIGAGYGIGAARERDLIDDPTAPMTVPGPDILNEALQTALSIVGRPASPEVAEAMSCHD